MNGTVVWHTTQTVMPSSKSTLLLWISQPSKYKADTLQYYTSSHQPYFELTVNSCHGVKSSKFVAITVDLLPYHKIFVNGSRRVTYVGDTDLTLHTTTFLSICACATIFDCDVVPPHLTKSSRHTKNGLDLLPQLQVQRKKGSFPRQRTSPLFRKSSSLLLLSLAFTTKIEPSY